MYQNTPAAASIRNQIKRAESAYQKGRAMEVIHHCKQVLAVQPRHVKALRMLGEMQYELGQYPEAIHCYQQAIAEEPAFAETYSRAAQTFEAMERPLEALQYAQRGAQIAPQDPDAHKTVIRLLLRFNMSHAALGYCGQILPLIEQNSQLMQDYAMTLKANEQVEEAERVYQIALSKFRVPLETRLMFETYIPRLMVSQEKIDAAREKLVQSFEKFIKEKAQFSPDSLGYMNLFNLAFHNRDNKEVMRTYAKMLRTCAPVVNFTARHCRKKPEYDGSRKIKLAFLSRYMHEHSVGRCYREMMRYLYRHPAFDVRLLMQEGVVDETIEALKAEGMKVVPLPKSLKAAQQVLEKEELDILVFTDIGMDAMTSYLAMGRFAHYQCVLTGHPETTGIDTIDYFISTRLYEPEHGKDNYTETLLQYPDTLDTLSARPLVPETRYDRAALGVPVDKKLYLVPMAIQKLHPDVDGVLAAIQQRDPNGVIVLFRDYQMKSASATLEQRVASRCDMSRVVFLDWQPYDKLVSLFRECDAVLSTMYFGAGTTGQLACAMGVPMVSLAGNYARSRMVKAFYDLMGITDAPVAYTPEAYVEAAYKVANDMAYREKLSQEIDARSKVMFEENASGEAAVQLYTSIMKQDLSRYL